MLRRTYLHCLLAFPVLLGLWACRLGDPEVQEQLKFDLQDSLFQYDSVVIEIVEPGDSAKVLEAVWDGKLAQGQQPPAHTLGKAKGKDFIIRVRGYNAGELVYENDIARVGDRMTPNRIPDSLLIVKPPYLINLSAGPYLFAPAFDRDSLYYAIEARNLDSILSFTPLALSGMFISIQGDTVASGQKSKPINLPVGESRVEITVKNGKGKAVTYTLKITRSAEPPSKVAELKSLVPSHGNLSPDFHKDSLEYRIFYTGMDSRTFTLQAESEHKFADVSVNTHSNPTRGAASGTVTLREGTNRITVRIVAEDGSATRTYGLNVTVPPASMIGF